MAQDPSSPGSGSKASTPKRPLTSSHSSGRKRARTCNDIQEADPKHDRVPPAPVSTAPPIKLARRRWADSKPTKINRTPLKEPKGIPHHRQSSSLVLNRANLKRIGALYKYTKLAQNQIRLLVLKPGTFDDDVYISLLTVDDDLAGGDDWPYCALSYHWGEGEDDNTVYVQDHATLQMPKTPEAMPTPLEDIVQNIIDAKRTKEIRIKPNLFEVLKILRDEREYVSLWVDALCINQFDETEKNDQVRKMALIYSRAYNVNIWLGSEHTDTGSPVSDIAMAFIPKVIDSNMHSRLLSEDSFIKCWASLFELLRWSWFSRRWIIQELALAQEATVHCGKHVCIWSEFQTAIAIFDNYFDVLKPKLISHFEHTQPDRWSWDDDLLRIKHLGAKLLVDLTSSLFRKTSGGVRTSTKGLETLVCTLSGFDTSDPRDTINALRNISRELNRPESSAARQVPIPDYGKDLFEVYRDFVRWVVTTSDSLDILCRFWALKERHERTPTTPRLVQLPSWIQFVEDSAWGKGKDVFNGRQAGDSFVGLPGNHPYDASGQGASVKKPIVHFPGSQNPTLQDTALGSTTDPKVHHDMSITIRGVRIGTVDFHTDPFPDGIITKDCLDRLGWSFDRSASFVPEVPAQLWQSLVADRGPGGTHMPAWYESACRSVLAHQSNNGHINIDKIISISNKKGQSSTVVDYLRRVKGVTWNRSFIEGRTSNDHEQFVGFAPPTTYDGDVVVILFGCSVPVVLRPLRDGTDDIYGYLFVGEAYIHGNMDGEALDEGYEELDFKII